MAELAHLRPMVMRESGVDRLSRYRDPSMSPVGSRRGLELRERFRVPRLVTLFLLRCRAFRQVQTVLTVTFRYSGQVLFPEDHVANLTNHPQAHSRTQRR